MLLRFAIISLLTLAKISEGSLRPLTEQQQDHRELYESIANYYPSSLVIDENAIDLDVFHINEALKEGNFADAYSIYQYGAYSKPVATLSLLAPLPFDLNGKTPVQGINNIGNKVLGFLYEDSSAGSKTIRIQYHPTNYNSDINCFVGGNPNPKTDGCFEQSGTITFNGNFFERFEYEYSILDDNHHERTLQKLTVEAYENMYECDSGHHCPYTDYQKFYDYYKIGAYADNIITAALEGKTTTEFNKGEIDFEDTISNTGRLEAFRKTLTQLVMWMNVIRQMEDAIDGCLAECTSTTRGVDNNCKTQDEITHSWDQAVAFYSGSMEGGAGTGKGVLLYAHAEESCRTMNTCSKVNAEIPQQFRLGQDLLKKRQCTNVIQEKNRIVKLMIIPNIQDTLYHAFQLSQYDHESDDVDTSSSDYIDEHERKVGGGAIAAASILPYIHACNETDAEIIYANMKYKSLHGKTDFDLVKNALERNYHCLGIKCDDIGGIINPATNEYYDNASPCNDQQLLSTWKPNPPPSTPTTNPPPSEPTTDLNTNNEGIAKENNKKNNHAAKVIGIILVIGLIVIALIVFPKRRSRSPPPPVEIERNPFGEFSSMRIV